MSDKIKKLQKDIVSVDCSIFSASNSLYDCSDYIKNLQAERKNLIEKINETKQACRREKKMKSLLDDEPRES